MDIRLHFVRQLVTSNLIKLRYIRTENNFADFLTKPTGRTTIRRALAAIGVRAPENSASRQEAQSNPACQNIKPAAERAVKRCRGDTSFLTQQSKPQRFVSLDMKDETNISRFPSRTRRQDKPPVDVGTAPSHATHRDQRRDQGEREKPRATLVSI